MNGAVSPQQGSEVVAPESTRHVAGAKAQVPGDRSRPEDHPPANHAQNSGGEREGAAWKVDVLGVLRRRWLIIVACALLIPMGPIFWVLGEEPTYRSESLIAVAPPEPKEPDYPYVPAFETARTVRDVVLSQGVAADASAAMGGQPSASDIQERVSAEAEPKGWQTVAVRTDASSPAAAQELNQVVVDAALPSSREAVREGSRVVVAVTAGAGEPLDRPKWPQVLAIVGLALLIGLVIATIVDMIAAVRGARE